MAKFQVANQNKISNQIRSQIRSVHGTKHHDKIIENGPNGKNDQKYSKTIYSYILKKIDTNLIQKRKQKIKNLWPRMYQILMTILSKKQFHTLFINRQVSSSERNNQ